ncbi:MAG: rhomboid family intramembrane serine protease, partial [Bacteroidia bacterium]
MDLLANLKAQFRQGSSLLKLIYINTALFLFFVILKIVGTLFNAEDIESTILGYLAAPASLDRLISRPWTVFTYMFLHLEFFHLLFNMLWL